MEYKIYLDRDIQYSTGTTYWKRQMDGMKFRINYSRNLIFLIRKLLSVSVAARRRINLARPKSNQFSQISYFNIFSRTSN